MKVRAVLERHEYDWLMWKEIGNEYVTRSIWKAIARWHVTLETDVKEVMQANLRLVASHGKGEGIAVLKRRGVEFWIESRVAQTLVYREVFRAIADDRFSDETGNLENRVPGKVGFSSRLVEACNRDLLDHWIPVRQFLAKSRSSK